MRGKTRSANATLTGFSHKIHPSDRNSPPTTHCNDGVLSCQRPAVPAISLWSWTPGRVGRKDRHPRRAILIYLVAIVGPTLVLLYLGLQSVDRQRQAISTLSENNLRLTAERVAAELAHRTEHLVGLCLRDPELTTLRLPATDDDRPELFRPVRTLLQQVKARHPIADLLFVLQDGRFRYPRLFEPPPRRLEEYLAREQATLRQQFAKLFEEAEGLELQANRPREALIAYRRSAELPVSDTLRAIALARMARNARKANQPHLAQQAYITLRDRYADLYDPFHRPFGLVAGLELSELAGSERPSLDIATLENDLLRGRWELSVEQFDYFRARIAERISRPDTEFASTYAHELKLAEALHDSFRLPGALRTGDLYPSASSPGGDRPYQTYVMLAGAPNENLTLGLAVDLSWIEHQLVQQVAADLGIDSPRIALSRPTTGGSLRPTVATVATVFPFWELTLASTNTPGQSPARQRYAFVGSTLLVLAVLMLGVVLLMRDASRQLQLGQLRTDFVSGVSHELKTPLTLIRLYSETLSESAQVADDERKEYADIITRESDRLTQLIDNVLEFSRIDRGQKRYRVSEGDLAPVVGRTVGAYALFLRRRGYTVDVDLPAELPTVRFDPDAVAAAVVNLLDNAAKYAGTAKFVAVRLRADGDHVVCEVEDRGVGIASAEHSRLFEQFFRGASASDKGGHGLGLFLVKHIMDAHEGCVEFDSVVGQGSRFRLVFPIRARAADSSVAT